MRVEKMSRVKPGTFADDAPVGASFAQVVVSRPRCAQFCEFVDISDSRTGERIRIFFENVIERGQLCLDLGKEPRGGDLWR